MRTNTDGSMYVHVDMCAYCQLDSGGNHQAHCPITTEAPILTATKAINPLWVSLKSQTEV